MEENPYNAPTGKLSRQNQGWLTVWRRVLSGGCFLFAFAFAAVALKWAVGGWRWIQTEAAVDGGEKLTIYGFTMSYGQVLLLGAATAFGLALLWLYVGLRIIPPATQD
jgi:hypothetical protein